MTAKWLEDISMYVRQLNRRLFGASQPNEWGLSQMFLFSYKETHLLKKLVSSQFKFCAPLLACIPYDCLLVTNIKNQEKIEAASSYLNMHKFSGSLVGGREGGREVISQTNRLRLLVWSQTNTTMYARA